MLTNTRIRLLAAVWMLVQAALIADVTLRLVHASS